MKNAVKVYVEKAEDGTYWGSTQNIPGGVSAYGESLEDLKLNLKKAFADYLEVSEDLEEDWLGDVKAMDGFEYNLDIPSFFKLLPVKISAIAEKAGINASLMRQYATGKANASEERAKQIEKAIHELGEDLLSVSL
ncbi:type II toxin-antitoxin system HicB family antitoxin [Autumnicola edwardsiae]|uniref:Type II toxin-antitoxin system HicB family antitoxin n=1 Tax=Autumnicola edwardsiae TaxID=3075594 RepID=A0ABU3CVD3_9FLAO|nr:type II toxin-antitoxin system HicB family antitoxin [Zunongwangia sp. F297]MDT0650203.1 type II toxin-antitoxin system HicB family antitoxin [Zunongwangia sp. F297]